MPNPSERSVEYRAQLHEQLDQLINDYGCNPTSHSTWARRLLALSAGGRWDDRMTAHELRALCVLETLACMTNASIPE